MSSIIMAEVFVAFFREETKKELPTTKDTRKTGSETSHVLFTRDR